MLPQAFEAAADVGLYAAEGTVEGERDFRVTESPEKGEFEGFALYGRDLPKEVSDAAGIVVSGGSVVGWGGSLVRKGHNRFHGSGADAARLFARAVKGDAAAVVDYDRGDR